MLVGKKYIIAGILLVLAAVAVFLATRALCVTPLIEAAKVQVAVAGAHPVTVPAR